MFKEIVIIGLLGHVIGDYYLQTEAMAKKKKIINQLVGWKFYALHILLYSLVQIVLFTVILGVDIGWVGCICVAHAIVDILKITLEYKYESKLHESTSYFIDQIIHMVIIVLFSVIIVKNDISIAVNQYLIEILKIVNLQNYNIIKLVIIAIVLHKPINITCKIMLSKYKISKSSVTNKNEMQTNSLKAGALIGTFERLIIAAMIYKGEYSAIGLIFAAKSVARYDKISSDKEFAEYYLLGSLMSVLSVLIVYGLVM